MSSLHLTDIVSYHKVNILLTKKFRCLQAENNIKFYWAHNFSSFLLCKLPTFLQNQQKKQFLVDKVFGIWVLEEAEHKNNSTFWGSGKLD